MPKSQDLSLINLNTSVQFVTGVGLETSKKLKKLGIETIRELLEYFPRAYDDFSTITKIKDIRPGKITVEGSISNIRSRYSRRGLHITEALLSDESGSVTLIWFNQPYRAKSLKTKSQYLVSGEFAFNKLRLSVVNPRLEESTLVNKKSGLILPIYRETKGLNSAQLRKIVHYAMALVPKLEERLPTWIINEYGLLSLEDAVRKLHFPESITSIEKAENRFSFEEIFELQLSSELQRLELSHEKAPAIHFNEDVAKNFVDSLPYRLTDDQRKAVWQIYKDMSESKPMNRLLEGDVGSGKTIVAAMAALMVMITGRQVLYMAPTEILARQQADTFLELLKNTQWSNSIGLLVGGISKKTKEQLYQRISKGHCRLVVGTHAIIQDAVAAENVGLVIIDEQHRFGVEQRQKLRKKAGLFPHVLCMTATPIPRSLALTLYGELDLTIISELPPGREQTITEIVPFSTRAALYNKIDKEIASGRQVFVVCPLISESNKLQVKAAESLFTELKDKLLIHRQIGLLHGGMKSVEKDKIMQNFVSGKIDVLVSTTVVEVGVNVPNASVMIIEGAERFGLAQIHQLRGRVGRGNHQGYCYLVPSQEVGMTRRLKAVASTNSGFKLAELDLEIRGPGAIYGERQSGVLDLRFARFEDRKLIEKAKQAAKEFINRGEILIEYPYLDERIAHFRSISRLN